MFGFVLIS